MVRTITIVSLGVVGAVSPILIPVFTDIRELINSYKKSKQSSNPPSRKNRQPKISKNPIYVALGSSFAAGPGAGEYVENAIGKSQGQHGYPNSLARKFGSTSDEYVNAASSGELLSKIIESQLKYISESTQLVTITGGGNDVCYTKDFMLGYLRAQMHSGVTRRFLDWLLPMVPADQRDFESLAHEWDSLCAAIRQKSPHAKLVVVTYISIIEQDAVLDPLTPQESSELRNVAARLSQTTREAAERNNCVSIDMTTPSHAHCAGSEEPWATGFDDIVPVHPNAEGHKACAGIIFNRLKELNVLPRKTSL